MCNTIVLHKSNSKEYFVILPACASIGNRYYRVLVLLNWGAVVWFGLNIPGCWVTRELNWLFFLFVRLNQPCSYSICDWSGRNIWWLFAAVQIFKAPSSTLWFDEPSYMRAAGVVVTCCGKNEGNSHQHCRRSPFDPLAALGNSECAMWVARYARQNVMNHCDMQARRAWSPGPCLVCLAQAIVTNSDK